MTPSAQSRPTAVPSAMIGIACGIFAAVGWAAGFVSAKHGLAVGLSPEDIAFHRFVWAGLALAPLVVRDGIGDLGGVGWRRGLIMVVLAGPLQAVISYTGLTVAPLGHGAVIHPSSAMLGGLLLATLVLGERLSLRRALGAGATIIGLVLLAAESITTIGRHGLLGDLCFMTAGIMWAIFSTLLRRWQVGGPRAAIVISALSLVIYTPVHAVFFGFDRLIKAGLYENLLQMVVQGGLAGALAIYLFTRAVIALGAGRAAAFPALVPASTLLIGFLALGDAPSAIQIVGLIVVAIGFRLAL